MASFKGISLFGPRGQTETSGYTFGEKLQPTAGNSLVSTAGKTPLARGKLLQSRAGIPWLNG